MRTTTDTPAHLVPPPDIDRTADPLDERNIAQANARECIRRARRARAAARRTYGDRGEPNPCPVSAGLCDHWPETTKDEIAGFEMLAIQWDDIARAYHRAAGKRRSTFPAQFSRLPVFPPPSLTTDQPDTMNAREICHHYAAQPDKDRESRNVSIRDGTLYSYAAPIAHLTGNPALPLLYSARTHSVTTAKHISFARGALHHIAPALEVYHPAAAGAYQHAENFTHIIRDGIQALKAAGAPRIRETTRAQHIANACRHRDNAELYRTAFRLPLAQLDKETRRDRATLAKLSPETATAALAAVKRHEHQAEKRREKARAENQARWVKQEAEQAERNAAALAAWTAGERETPPRHHAGETRLRVRAGNVETSHGANVPAADALRLWPLADRAHKTGETYHPTGRHAIGIHALDHVSPQGARIGCHFIPFDEMQRIRPEVEAAALATT